MKEFTSDQTHLPTLGQYSGKTIIDLDFPKPYNEISNNLLLQSNRHGNHKNQRSAL